MFPCLNILNVAELRLMVLRLLLISYEVISIELDALDPFNWIRRHDNKIFPHVLRVNHSICNDGRSILYGENTFNFKNSLDLDKFLSNSEISKPLKHFSIGSFDLDDVLQRLTNGGLSHLMTLDIVIYHFNMFSPEDRMARKDRVEKAGLKIIQDEYFGDKCLVCRLPDENVSAKIKQLLVSGEFYPRSGVQTYRSPA
jgi:hypothetical protein